jgi:hypothetical protein
MDIFEKNAFRIQVKIVNYSERGLHIKAGSINLNAYLSNLLLYCKLKTLVLILLEPSITCTDIYVCYLQYVN